MLQYLTLNCRRWCVVWLRGCCRAAGARSTDLVVRIICRPDSRSGCRCATSSWCTLNMTHMPATSRRCCRLSMTTSASCASLLISLDALCCTRSSSERCLFAAPPQHNDENSMVDRTWDLYRISRPLLSSIQEILLNPASFLEALLAIFSKWDINVNFLS